jgi:hypothetical protein
MTELGVIAASLQRRQLAMPLGLLQFRIIGTNFVVLEVARELRRALGFEQTLEAAPGGIAGFLTTTLGRIQVFVDLVQIDVALFDNRLFCVFIFELVGFAFLTHPDTR